MNDKTGVRPHLVKRGLTPVFSPVLLLPFLKVTLVSLLALAIVSCSGWRLRGSDNTVLPANSIFLSGDTSATYSLVREQLIRKNALATLSDNTANPQYRLVLGKETIQRRSVTVSGSATTTEYELTLVLNYRVLDAQQQPLRPQQTVRLSRSFVFDENDVAGRDKEEELLRRDLRRAAARQILQQLQFL